MVKKAGISINGKRIVKYFKSKTDRDVWLNEMRLLYRSKSLPGEVWRKVPGFSLYEASDMGRIRSTNYKRSGIVRVLAPHVTGGYLQTMLQNDYKKYITVKVHKIITLTFYGERKEGQEVNHIDGDKLNNAKYNLEYCSRSENCQHSFDTGLQKAKRGELNGMAKLTREQVDYARHLKNTKGRYWGRNELAEQYGVTAKHLQDVVNNPKSWK